MVSERLLNISRYGVPTIQVQIPSDLGTMPMEVPFAGAYKSDLPTDLYFYANLRPGAVLYVTMHGATRRGVDTYPRFDRTASFEKAKVPLLAFSDPSLALDPELELSWYLGGAGWDPQQSIIELIESARSSVGASSVCVIGGSGGGFAALRLSYSIPSSLAFVFNPQIRLADYIARVRDYYFRSMHGDSAERVIARSPDIFDMSRLYSVPSGTNYVYYLQNITDSSHVRSHYKPFKDAIGVSSIDGVDSSDSIQLKLIDSVRFGHTPPSPNEFSSYLAEALEWAGLTPPGS